MRNHFLVLLALAAGALAFSSANLWLNEAQQRLVPVAKAGEVEDLRDVDSRRAVAISVDATVGVAGFVAPGDRVDIMLMRKIEGQFVSSIVLQDVRIVAVEQRARAEMASPPLFRMVTVEVDTRDAQKLALAQQVGRLLLTLRGLGESDELNDELEPKDQPFDPDIFPWYYENAG